MAFIYSSVFVYRFDRDLYRSPLLCIGEESGLRWKTGRHETTDAGQFNLVFGEWLLLEGCTDYEYSINVTSQGPGSDA